MTKRKCYFEMDMATGEKLLLTPIYAEAKDQPYALVKYPPKPRYAGAAGKPYTDSGLSEPHGSLLRIRHRHRSYHGQILDGDLVFNDRRFRKPSPAVNAVVDGSGCYPNNLNGWDYIQVQRPGTKDWLHFSELRQKAREARRASIAAAKAEREAAQKAGHEAAAVTKQIADAEAEFAVYRGVLQ
jgi:hypothetical protein